MCAMRGESASKQKERREKDGKCSLLIFNSIWSHKSGFRLSTHKLSESHSNVKNIYMGMCFLPITWSKPGIWMDVDRQPSHVCTSRIYIDKVFPTFRAIS